MLIETGSLKGIEPEAMKIPPTRTPEEVRQLVQEIAAWRDEILRICRSWLRCGKNPDADAEDAASETIKRAIENIHTYRGEGLKAWLGVIAKNVVNRNRQMAARSRAVDIEGTADGEAGQERPGLESLPDPSSGEDAMIRNLDMKKFEQAVRNLPAHYREPLELAVQGYEYKEIAEKLKTSIASVKNNLLRARRQIGDQFGLANLRINKRPKKAA